MKLDISNKEMNKIRDVVVFFAFKTPHLTATRLQKFFYLAELKAIERLGRRLTNARFLNYNYGPWSPDIALVSDGFEHQDIQIEKGVVSGYEARFYRPSIPETNISLSKEEIKILEEVIAKTRYRKTHAIVREVKVREPFIWSKPKEKIDFDAYLQCTQELYHNPEVEKIVKENLKAKGQVFSSAKELTKALTSE